MPADGYLKHMMHVGIIVNSLEPEMKFYTEVLGFKEIWRGSSNGKVLSWVNLRVPDGRDYIEFMLYKESPPPNGAGLGAPPLPSGTRHRRKPFRSECKTVSRALLAPNADSDRNQP